MPSDYHQLSEEAISNTNVISNKLIEKMLTLRSTSYFSQIKAQLLTNTIYEIDSSKKVLFNTNSKLEKEIRERKLAEARLKEALIKAEEATKLKDKFVALVSHDLKDPLGLIMGYLQLAQITAGNPREVSEMIETSLSACNDMNNLINDILSLSRIQNGKLKPECAMTDIANLATLAINFYSKIASDKEIMLSNKININTCIYADEKLLFEVINNLISNAIKFCNKGDSIKIYIPQEETSTIIIADTGIGIAETIIDDIFHYEKKTSTIGTVGESGTGFGLPLSHDIVKAHGGNLQVKSTLGEGTTFYIKLPPVQNSDTFLQTEVGL
ncbi:MAG: HAMP domain-containing histidine kinase [Methyloprofundus sp.]|nr:HAMP domain-containing histidine kinase [Methyloprofundus sp.]